MNKPTPESTVVHLVLCATLLASGCAFSIDGELPNMTVSQQDVWFAPAPAHVDLGEQSLKITYTPAKTKLALPRDAFAEVKPLSVSVVPKRGVSDLTFVRSLRVSISTADPSIANPPAPVEIARYERDADDNFADIIAPSSPGADLTDLWRAGNYTVTVEATGLLPQVGWSVDVNLNLSAKIKY